MITEYQQYQQHLLTLFITWMNRMIYAVLIVNSYWFFSDFWGTLLQQSAAVLIVAIGWWCRQLLQQERIRLANRIYLTTGMLLPPVLVMTLSEAFIPNAALGMTVFIVLAIYIEPYHTTLRWGALGLGLYICSLTLRILATVWEYDFPVAETVALYLFPLIILPCLIFMGRNAAGRLHTALYDSETHRQDLQQKNHEFQELQTQLHAELAEHKQAERRLEASETRLQQLLAINPAVIYAASLQDEQFLLTFVSANLEQCIGYKPEDFIGHLDFWFQCLHPDDTPRVLETSPRLLEQGYDVFEYRFRHRDGGYRWLHDEMRLVRDAAGNLVEVIGCWLDITEHKRMEEELRASEEQYRTLVIGIRNGFFTTDADGIITFANQALADIFGHDDPQAMIGASFFRYLAPEGKADTIELFRNFVTHGRSTVSSVEIPVTRPDGRQFFIELESAPIIQGETVLGTRGVIRDITTRKRAEEKLRQYREHLEELVHERTTELQQINDRLAREIEERRQTEAKLSQNEQRLQLALEAANDGIWDWNIMTDSSYWSPRYYTMLGYAPEEMPATTETFGTWLHPDDRHRVFEHLQTCIATGEEYQAEFRMRTKSGDWRWIFSRGKVVEWNVDGQPCRIVGTHVDITPRKQAEEQLQKSEIKYRTLVESATDFIYLISRNYTVLSLNTAAARLFGKEPEAIVGQSIQALFPPDIAAHFVDGLEYVFETGIPRVSESRMMVGARAFWISVSLNPVRDQDGHVNAIMGITRDITDRKQAEEKRRQLEAQLRQSQKLEALGTLAGGVAHDFNNILGTMMGYTELLHDKHPDDSREKEYLEYVYRAGERARDLIKQILAFSRTHKQHLIPTDLALVIEETLNMIRATIPTTVEIRHSIEPHCRPILADAGQLQQVIMNLCINAAHAMKEQGGVLEVRLEETQGLSRLKPAFDSASASLRVEPEALASGMNPQEGNSYLKLTIKDTGCGMTPEVQERIFEPFFTTKEVGEGAGLGLSVVHGIVTGHHGTITVASEPGKGTTVQIFFPVTDEPVIQEEQVTDKTTERKDNGHILIIEDEVELSAVYEIALTELGFQVTTLHHGDEALETFKVNPDRFDLIITDQAMPGMTGTHLSQELLQMRPDLPIILMTGYSDTISEREATDLGIRHFLMKPLKIADLIRVIRKIFATKTRRHEGTKNC